MRSLIYEVALLARITELEAQLAAVAWQPISTAPKDSFSRLYMVNGRCVQGFFDATGMLCAQTDYQPWRKMYGNPTHWMPLPKPPIVGAATERLKSGGLANE
jgi:hypothetical protein